MELVFWYHHGKARQWEAELNVEERQKSSRSKRQRSLRGVVVVEVGKAGMAVGWPEYAPRILTFWVFKYSNVTRRKSILYHVHFLWNYCCLTCSFCRALVVLSIEVWRQNSSSVPGKASGSFYSPSALASCWEWTGPHLRWSAPAQWTWSGVETKSSKYIIWKQWADLHKLSPNTFFWHDIFHCWRGSSCK